MKKIRIFALPSHQTIDRTSGVDFARIIQPMQHLNGWKDDEVEFEVTMFDINETTDWLYVAKNYDIIYLNYIANSWGYAAMGAMARKHGVKLVLDVDDSLWNIRSDNSAYIAYHKGSEPLNHFTCICDDVDYMTCTNSYLKNVIVHNTHKKHDQIKVFPNYIDLDLYRFRPPFKDTAEIQLTHFGCFDDKTEILTENGFRLFKDLKKEKVATLNSKGELEYQFPIKYQKYKFDDELIYAEGYQFNFAVTPNHQLYTKTRGGKYGIKTAEDLYKKNYFLKKDAKWKGLNQDYFKIPGYKKVKMNDWLKFFGFWLAEGWTTKSKFKQKSGNITNCMQVGVGQLKNNGYLEEMQKLLISFGFKIYVNKRQVRVCNKIFWEYLKQFGEARDKFIPREIKNLSSKKLKILLEWYLKGDGHIEVNGRIRATTISKRLVDDLTEIALKIGWSANYYKKESKDVIIEGRFIPKERQQSCYVIAFLRNTGRKNCLHSHVFPKHQSKRHYKGFVYDVEVFNHTLYVRRDGKSMWSGNSTTHFTDLQEESFFKGVDRIMKDYPNVTFKTIGAFIPKYKHRWGQRYKHGFGDSDIYKWINDKFPTFMEETDILVVPLSDDTYNRCKSSIKWIEASSAGKPGVWQDIRQYSEVIDGKNGLLARTADEWYKQIKKLIDDKELRRSMGEKAFADVEKGWNIKRNIGEYALFFKSILGIDRP
jgi:glycosyltransferase involved in cell wall biosynthesis